MKGNLLVGQSGGPTSVINSSLAGVIEKAKLVPEIGHIYGMNFGIEGFMQERLIDLGAQSLEVLAGLRRTPGSALGSSRHKVKDADLPRILEVLKKFDIRYFFLIGGNDTMDTIQRVEAYCRSQGYELRGIGVPKTVDNDLFGTHHTPGFASAARSNILNVKQAGVLSRDMQKVDQFVIYQTIGRDAGWLAASTALAKENPEDGPHLIYIPERPFFRDDFLTAAKKVYDTYGWVSIVCGEGIKYADGTPVSASQAKDRFNNTEFGAMGGSSVAMQLHRMLTEAYGWRGEFQITESLIMSAFDRAEARDLAEAYGCGVRAVELAQEGLTGYMVTLTGDALPPDPRAFGKAPLNQVAIAAKPMPDSYINNEGTFPTDEFLAYCRPLIGPLPSFTRLSPIFAQATGSVQPQPQAHVQQPDKESTR
ncbi:MAG: diphosphate--fructose-6-phosphate 1-phosphotransferase [Spirochaetales bacterium]|nr:diphosphate--fructose-6-phosphate 1-phosphotransferase [Spirochaetales bacterium]